MGGNEDKLTCGFGGFLLDPKGDKQSLTKKLCLNHFY